MMGILCAPTACDSRFFSSIAALVLKTARRQQMSSGPPAGGTRQSDDSRRRLNRRFDQVAFSLSSSFREHLLYFVEIVMRRDDEFINLFLIPTPWAFPF
jgi:hypothetical protein